MADPVKIPERHVWTNPAAMKVGDKAAYSLEAMCVDQDGYGWIDPTAIPNPASGVGALNLLRIERVEGGFKVDFSKGDHCWPRVPTPQAKDGLEWLPVVEFIEGKATVKRLV